MAWRLRVVHTTRFAYETAAIVREGLRRMFGANEDVLYYLALYNENYPQAAMPDGAEKGILRGLYRFKEGPANRKHAAQILGSGSMLPVALSAQQLLTDEFDVSAAVWSATSYQQLRADALEAERWNRLHPTEVGREAFVSKALGSHEGPVIAVTDSMRAVPDQIARWVDGPFLSLGTDGFGRSDTRENLRRFFEMDADHVVVATLASLARMGEVKPEVVADAIRRFEIDPERVPPFLQP